MFSRIVNHQGDTEYQLTEEDRKLLDEEVVKIETLDEIPLGCLIDFSLSIRYDRENRAQLDGNPGLTVRAVRLDDGSFN